MRYLYDKILIISLFLIGCAEQKAAPETCMENPDVEGKMLVIIGEKIALEELPQEEDGFLRDAKFLAKYKIAEIVCGTYIKDTISFIVYDHYGIPPFSKYKNAMLFLSQNDSSFYHMKYQFFDVYKTKDGRWASSYKAMEHSQNVKPVPIQFEEEVSYHIIGGKKKLIKQYFPEPYYRLTKEKAIAVWGNYVPELFQIKKEGVLKARGLFGNPDSGFQIIETQMAEIKEEDFINISKKEKNILTNTFYQLITAIRTKNTQQIRRMSFDSIYCSICEGIRDDYYDNDLEDIRVYIDSAYQHFPNEEIWGPRDGKYRLSFYATESKVQKPVNFLHKDNDKLIIYELHFYEQGKLRRNRIQKSHSFKFLKINGMYKFYGMTSY